MKSDRSWIGSLMTIERAFPMERTSAPQPSETAQPRLPRASARGARVPIGRNAGGHGEAGMESEEGTAFESLPRRKPGRELPISSFFFQLRIRSFVPRWCFSCVALASQVSSTARKVGEIIAQGGRRWLIGVYLGRDDETDEGNSTTEPFRVPCAKR